MEKKFLGVLDDLSKTFSNGDEIEGFWVRSHYTPEQEMQDVMPQNPWLGKGKEVKEDG